MNAVHPIFLHLCNAVCPPILDAAIHCPAGMHEYEHRIGALKLTCHLEYEPADERGTCAGPAQGAIFRLVHAYVNGVDVVQIIAPALVEEIEEKAAQEEDHYAY